MTLNANTRLAPRQRLARGLKYSAVGPVDVTRGVVGLSADTVSTVASELHRRYESGKLRRQLTAAAEAVAALPVVLQEAAAPPEPKRCRRPLLIAGVAAAVLAGGAVAFSILRRSNRPEPPSTLPPSVEVAPKP